jgi:L-iditol 2-dehydrogenase
LFRFFAGLISTGDAMKALVLTRYQQLDYQDVPPPSLEADEVLVAVRACGICGSDVHGLDGSTGRRRPPLVMGHEAAGVIAELGRSVEGWRVGDRVTFDSTVSCGVCRPCRAGQINLCDNRRVLGVSCDEYRRNGAFAEYVAVPQQILYRLPDELSFARAAMVEPVSVAVHAVGRVRIRLNDTALVVGAGMIGLLVIQALRAAGCSRVIAVDVDPGRLELARRLGATETLSSHGDDPLAALLALTEGRGADVVVEAVGLAATVALAIGAARKGGQVVLVGNLSPRVELPLQVVVSRELTLYGSCASSGEYPACLDLIARGTIDVDCLTSGVAPLADGAAWFQRLYQREPGLMKVILEP